MTMDRRDVLLASVLAGVGTTAFGAAAPVQAQEADTRLAGGDGDGVLPPLHVGMLVYPNMVMLDLAEPLTALSYAGATCHLVGASLRPVATDLGIPVRPTATFETCPRDLDMLFVPGGLKGTIAVMDDSRSMAFLADRGGRATWVTSVCTGSLALAAAGLLKGYKATSHWDVAKYLPLMGAELAAGRVVEDRNRITAGGVTAGMDFGLTLVSRLRNERIAKRIQLALEYNPQPPFQAGTPRQAGAALTADVSNRLRPTNGLARAASIAAAARLRL